MVNLSVGKYELYLRAGFRPSQSLCMGMTNKIIVGGKPLKKFVVFSDHDDISLKDLMEKWAVAADSYDLGYTYIFQTREDGMHWQAINPVYCSLGTVCQVMYETACDQNFMGIGLKNGFWTLRVFEKDDRKSFAEPVLKTVIKRSTSRLYSQAHLEFIAKYYKGEEPKSYGKLMTDLEVLQYYTSNFQRRGLI